MLRERPAVVFEMSGPTTGRPGSRAAGEIVHDVHRPRTTAPGDRMALPPGRPGPGRSRPGLFWGKRRPFQAKPIGQTFNSRNATWDVIETPGHTKDHLSFLNQETGQLFTED